MPRSAIPRLTFRQTAVLVCVLFTVLTLLSSVIGVVRGNTTDTHVHILQRLAYTTVGVGSIHLFGILRAKLGTAMGVVATYAAAMAVVLAFTWTVGLVDELHPDAYRDIFLNFSVVYFFVAVGFLGLGWWRRRFEGV